MSASSDKTIQDILIVDDILTNLKVLSETLINNGYQVREVRNSPAALSAIAKMPPELILLDLSMSDFDGYQVCQQLKANQATCDIPVIFLAASGETVDKVKAFDCGGADYITKPFQIEEVLARVKNQLEMKAAQNRIRQLNAELAAKVQEKTKYLRQKINELEKTKTTLHYIYHDRFTGLPNQLGLTRNLEDAISNVKKEKGCGFATLLLEFAWGDLSQFESNLVEHKLIANIAKKIASSLDETDILARIGTNKFVVMQLRTTKPERLNCLAQQIYQQFDLPCIITRQDIQVKINIGSVLYKRQYQKPANILRDAKLALCQARKQGKKHYLLK